MKKIVLSIGLAAVGAAGVRAAYAPDLTDDKTWSVSATLRGFYNDNYNYAGGSTGGANQDSFGAQLTPQFQIVKPMNQTEMGLRYIYSLYYYEQADSQNQNPYDQTHWVNLWLDHVFNERWEAKLSDTINVTQYPYLTGSGVTSDPFNNGNYINNLAQASISTDWTREFGTVVTYNNSLWMYDAGGGSIADLTPAGSSWDGNDHGDTGRGPSEQAQFNRIDQSLTLDLQDHTSVETVWGIGYTFDWVNYTANEPIEINASTIPPTAPADYSTVSAYYSDYLNSYSHTLYASYQHNLTDTLRATAQVGGQYSDSYNQNATSIAPFVDISATYNYTKSSFVSAGFTHSINQTYLANSYYNSTGLYTDNVNRGMESSTLYFTLNHQITPKLVLLVTSRYQTGDFIGGEYDGKFDDYYSAGVNFNYTIMPHLSVEAGYNYNQVDSVEPGASYRQNSYEIGVTGSY